MPGLLRRRWVPMIAFFFRETKSVTWPDRTLRDISGLQNGLCHPLFQFIPCRLSFLIPYLALPCTLCTNYYLVVGWWNVMFSQTKPRLFFTSADTFDRFLPGALTLKRAQFLNTRFGFQIDTLIYVFNSNWNLLGPKCSLPCKYPISGPFGNGTVDACLSTD